mmetsp:Transcript_30350/g.90453  ORF Transcript_30350/g.90453 Transcript_30350/m.90453 type:complete len:238 (+) Transcript_30350:469-1182(+)
MVAIVLVLPPLHRVALHEVAPEDTHEITILPLLEDLVVEEVMREPTTLLPEESHEEGRPNVDGNRIGVVYHCTCCRPHAHVEQAFVGIIKLGGFEHSHHDELCPKIAVPFLKSQLPLVLVRDRLWDEVSNKKFLYHGLGALRVEGGKDVRHIVTRVGKNNSTPRVVVPIGHIVNLVLVHDPRVLGGDVLLDLLPCVLGRSLSRRGGRVGRRHFCADRCFSALAHCDLFAEVGVKPVR